MLAMIMPFNRITHVGALAAILLAGSTIGATGSAVAQEQRPPEAALTDQAENPSELSFADFAAFVEAAPVVVLVEIQKQATVEPARAPGLAPGHARLYLEAGTEAVLAAGRPLGGSLRFLADVPLQANGKPPKIEKERFLLFGDSVSGRANELQLIEPNAMVPAEAGLQARIRALIAGFASESAPPAISGIRDVISVPGNLAGESETQMFIDTKNGAPLSLSVVRRPGMEPTWGVSWSEVVDQSARPPEPETVEWYRLACFLPPRLPEDSFLQVEAAARRQAEEDYNLVLEQLGPCVRHRS